MMHIPQFKSTIVLSLFRKFWTLRMTSSGLLRHVALVRAKLSEDLSASIIRVTRIGELGKTLALTLLLLHRYLLS
jgi:hypothetical protein